MRKTFLAMLLATALCPPPAAAQVPCAPRTEVMALLQQRHGEKVISLGVTSAGEVLELWASSRGLSWSIVVTLPSGTACVVAAGEHWQNVSTMPDGNQL